MKKTIFQRTMLFLVLLAGVLPAKSQVSMFVDKEPNVDEKSIDGWIVRALSQSRAVEVDQQFFEDYHKQPRGDAIFMLYSDTNEYAKRAVINQGEHASTELFKKIDFFIAKVSDSILDSLGDEKRSEKYGHANVYYTQEGDTAVLHDYGGPNIKKTDISFVSRSEYYKKLLPKYLDIDPEGRNRISKYYGEGFLKGMIKMDPDKD